MRYLSIRLNYLIKSTLILCLLFCATLAGSLYFIFGSVAASSSLVNVVNIFQSAEPEQEPNETAEQANPIGLPGQRTGTARFGDSAVFEFIYNNGPKDKIEDFYKFTVPDGQSKQVDIVLNFNNSAADLDLFLFRQDVNNLSAIAVSNGTAATERITPILTLVPGTYFIGVSAYDDPSNTGSATYTLSTNPDIAPPAPVITNISPVSAVAGGGPFSITVNGKYFINGRSVVRWNGQNRNTTYLGDTQLVAFFSPSDIATAGAATITVANPPELGGVSNSLNFTVLPQGASELEVEPNENSDQANLLLVSSKRSGTVTVGDAAQLIIQTSGGSSDPVEDLFAVNLSQNSRLDVLLSGANQSSNLALYVLKETADPSQLMMIGNSRFSGPFQRVTTPSVLAPGRYLVGVSAVTGSTDYTVEARVPGNRLLEVLTSTAAPNSTASVPVSYNAEGDERILNFSLSFKPNILSNPQVSLGNDALLATLNVNASQVAQGRIGVQIELPQGQRLSSGAREVLKLGFAVNSGAGINATSIDFIDQPVTRGIVDFRGTFFVGTYAAGTVVVVPGYEADVSPRPSGSADGSVTTADWVQVGRFVSGIDTTVDGGEFQRADCAPKATLGDGRLTIADWVLAGLYAAGLEISAPAGGPAGPLSTLADAEKSFEATASVTSLNEPEQTRTVRVKDATFLRGQNNQLEIELVSQGNENAIGFSVNFDTTQLAYVSAALGTDASGALLNINTSRLSEGRIGFGLALPSGQTFATGVRQVLRVTFNVPLNSGVNSTTVSFGDLPIAREIVDSTANILTAVYTPGVVTLNPPANLIPSLTSLVPGSVIVGSPSFALTIAGTNFVPGAVALVNGTARVTEFVTDTQLRVTVLAQDIDEVGTIGIIVQNPAPGGGTSNALTLSVVNPLPTLTSINPNSAAVNSRGFTMILTGTNFVPGAVVQFNGNNRPTSFVSSTQLNAQIPDSDLATVGTATVRVINPEPAGGQSNSLDFTISAPSPLPRITTISPETVQAGNPGFTLTVNGSGFVNSSVVRFNGNSLTTTYVSGTQLTAEVTAENIATAGTASITVFNPAPGGGNSNAVLLTINTPPNPLPAADSLNPAVVTAGGPGFALTVTGTNFVSNSVVRFNNQDRPTTFISPTELRAVITAVDIQNGGTASVRVFNPAPGGGLSNALNLTINFIAPVISTISPSSVVAGGQAFTLSVIGSNFAPGSVIRWNGEDRPTTYIGVTELTAQIPASDIVNVGAATITVFSPPPGGGLSNSLTFSINQAARPLPRLTSISPDTTVAGGPAFTLTVNGANFVSDSVVRWNGAPRPTTFVNSTQMTAQITAEDIASVGTALVTVFTPPAGGGESNSLPLAITSPPTPAPTINLINPGNVIVGSGAFVLTVNGTGFAPSSVVQVNGENRPTTYLSATQLTVQISASDVAVAGTLKIRVVTPPPGGGTSNEATLSIINPVPVITGIDPNVVAEGSPAFTLAVSGTGFVPGAEVRINGVRRTTSFVSGTLVTTQILASDLASIGTLSVQVFNPEPGGGLSNAVSLEIRSQNPLPRINTISPENVNAAGPGFTLVVNGMGFVRGSVVRVNGQDRVTDFISDTALATQITAADIVVAGSLSITVFNPAPGGGRSNSATLTVINPRPRITSLSPDNVPADAPGFPLIVNGEGFVTTSVVRFNGVDVPTTFVTSSQLGAQVPAALIPAGGTVPVTVFNPEPGGGISNPITFTINNVAPVIGSLTPDQVFAGGATFTLTVNGARFVNGAVVRINGQDRVTTFVSSNQVTAAILDTDIAVAGSANIVVFNPAPGGGASNPFPLVINNALPSLTGLNPASVTAGSAGFTLTVNGTGFIPGSVVQWNGVARQTTFVGNTQLTIPVTASDVANVGSASIVVTNPAPGGGVSNTLSFIISGQPNPLPLAVSLSPVSIPAGSGEFTLTVNGMNFVPGAVVQWNGSARPTTFVNDSRLTAQIPATDVATIGTANVTVFNPSPGGGASNGLTFTITPPNPVPALASLSPNSATVGTPAFNLTINGSNFVEGSVVQWNGSPRLTTFVNSTQLIAQVTAADVASLGIATLTVVNPAPGGGASNALTFTINAIPNPTPALVSVSPTSATEGDEAFAMTVTGTGFVAGSIVQWNGSPRPTTFVSGTQLSAQISQADVAVAGTVNVTVFNPAPGGGQSNPIVFTINPLIIDCNTICLRSAAYYSINLDRLPRGSIIVGGVNLNNPFQVQGNPLAVARALEGGSSPLQKLNQQYVATQLSVLVSGVQPGSETLLGSRLRCYGIEFAPVQLSNGFSISINTKFGDLLDQTYQAIVDNRTDDMLMLAAVLGLLNGNDPSGICRQ